MRFPPRARPARRSATAILALALPLIAWSQAAPRPPMASADLATGEVRKIEQQPPRLTLRHGEIKSLDMPPMTMPFRIASPELAKGLKVGDQVRFRAEAVGHEAVVTWLEVIR